jgi:SAM-dependent methyltransferase
MSKPAKPSYPGGELGLFAHATNWKKYWSSRLLPYLQGDVLEVGAGIGANSQLLRSDRQRRWVCLEPDAQLLAQARSALATDPLLAKCEFVAGTVADLDLRERFDAILYIDVLEHIEDDAAELRRVTPHLKDAAKLIVLSPAHAWLFSPFDAAIGHYRRYTRKTLLAAAAPGLALERVLYLDACGLLASLGNRLLLRQDLPTLKQILFWDRVLVPMSRWLDPLCRFHLGKSILAVWTKAGPGKTNQP